MMARDILQMAINKVYLEKIILFLTRFRFLYRTDELGLINKAQTLK